MDQILLVHSQWPFHFVDFNIFIQRGKTFSRGIKVLQPLHLLSKTDQPPAFLQLLALQQNMAFKQLLASLSLAVTVANGTELSGS